MNLDATKSKNWNGLNSVTNYHDCYSSGKQREQATYIAVSIIQSSSLRIWKETVPEYDTFCKSRVQVRNNDKSKYCRHDIATDYKLL
jgi:hypothetical protein